MEAEALWPSKRSKRLHLYWPGPGTGDGALCGAILQNTSFGSVGECPSEVCRVCIVQLANHPQLTYLGATDMASTTTRRRAAKKATPNALDALTDEQKQFIVDTTMNYDGGCPEGKRDFLKLLGLPVPPKRITVRFEITAPYIGSLERQVEFAGTTNNYGYVTEAGWNTHVKPVITETVSELKSFGLTVTPPAFSTHSYYPCD